VPRKKSVELAETACSVQFSIQKQPLRRIVPRRARILRLLYYSTLGSRVIQEKKKNRLCTPSRL